jgi:ABC-type transport system involved in cytochrome bd biosynthesis fused ATPase/permease subunit
MVQRFYDPQQGRVLFDGVPLPQIDNVFLHQSVALVAQEPLVFADSIKSNILFGVHRTNVTQVRHQLWESYFSRKHGIGVTLGLQQSACCRCSIAHMLVDHTKGRRTTLHQMLARQWMII